MEREAKERRNELEFDLRFAREELETLTLRTAESRQKSVVELEQIRMQIETCEIEV